jgi:hypothetical protein
VAEAVDEVVESEEAAPDGDAPPDADEVAEAELQTSELLEQVGRNASTLVLREVQLTTSRHIPELRRAARDLAAVAGVVVAFVTAFVLGNWALVQALSPSLPGWRAPLVLAAAWIALGGVLLVFLLARTGRLLGWRWWRAVAADPDEVVRDRERARDDAEAAMRESLGQFAEAIARDAGVLVTAAVVPLAGGAAEAGEKVLDAVDEMTDAVEEKIPGGGIVNRATDFALKPGRFALGVVGKGLKRGGSDGGTAK